MLERILVPMDGGLAERILPWVRGLVRRRPEAEVMLLGVVPDEGSQGWSGPLRAKADFLERRRATLLECGARVRYDVMTGEPTACILTFARQYRPTLIAMASRGRTGIDRWLHGSVTEEVLRRSEAPVLAANVSALPDGSGDARVERILVPLDTSERAARIIPLVREIATLFGAAVTVLHVVPSFVDHAGFPFSLPAPLTFELDGPEAALSAQAAPLRDAGIAVRQKIVFGEAAPHAIVDVARRESADLVALTTHGRSGISRWLFGSVAEEVLRTCNCPLLLERTVPVAIPEPTDEEADSPLVISSLLSPPGGP